MKHIAGGLGSHQHKALAALYQVLITESQRVILSSIACIDAYIGIFGAE